MSVRGIGLLVGVMALTGCSGGDEPVEGGEAPSCRPETSVTLTSTRTVDVRLGAEVISLPPDASARLSGRLRLDGSEVPLGIAGWDDAPVSDAVRSAVRGVGVDQRLLTTRALPAEAVVEPDGLDELRNDTDEQRRWAVYVATGAVNGSWVAEGCPEDPVRGTVQGWTGVLATGVLDCADGSLVAGDEVDAEVTADLCRA